MLSSQVKKNGVFIKVKNGKETKTFVDPETGKTVTKAGRILSDFGMTDRLTSSKSTRIVLP